MFEQQSQPPRTDFEQPQEGRRPGQGGSPPDSFLPQERDVNTSKFSTKRIAVFAAVVVLLVVVVYFSAPAGGSRGISLLPAQCAEAYEELLSANAFDFSHCTDTALRSGSFSVEPIAETKNNMVLVFDASGSMAGTVSGSVKIDVAKSATKKFLSDVESDDSLELGVVVYGHKGSNAPSDKARSCEGIEEIIPLGPVDSDSAAARIDSLKATGWTPIADSLMKAKEMLSLRPADANIVLLVSDGIETCDGDPVLEVERLRAHDPSIITSVIGFDVSGEDESQLREIARAGGGDYYSVKTAQEFAAAFAQHGQILEEANFTIGRTIEQVYDLGYITHTYNQCQMALRREEAAMMLDIHVSELVGKSCVTHADEAYRARFDEIETELRTQYETALQKFDALR